MAIFKCKMCGGNLEVQNGMTVCECEYCGSTQTVPTLDDEKKINLFTRANRLRASCEFDKAFGIYESIVTEFQDEAEAYWGLVLCKYGIEYVDDPKTGKKIPTCHRSSFDSVFEDSNFEMVMECADAMSRSVYREEAKVIEELRVGIIEVSSKEEPYDIFICYKETAENGERTIDSVLAQDVYDALTDKGYKVFFSRITLEDKLGQEYEPYIFAALNSAKVMLAFGTNYEYYNAVWVKNEWSRFLGLIEKGEKKTLIPCYKDIDAYDMPAEFKRLQAQDLGKVGAVQDLLRGIEKIIGKKNAEPETVASKGGNALTKRGYLYLEDKDYTKAAEYFEKALDENPEDGEAYLGKVFTKLRIQNLEELEALPISLDSVLDFAKAIRFSTENLKFRLSAILDANRKKVGSNKELVENILNGDTNKLVTLAPLLKQAVAVVDGSDITNVFGVSKAVLEGIFVKYEVYSVLEKSEKPLNTKEILAESAMFSNVSVDEMRGYLVELNHAGLIAFEDKHFAVVSDEYRSAKNAAQKNIYREQIEECEQNLSALTDRINTITRELDEIKMTSGDAIARAAEEKARIEGEVARLNKEITDEINRINGFNAIDMAEKSNVEAQINGLNRELSNLGIFQGKRKKEISEQIGMLNQQWGRINAILMGRQNELQNFVAYRKNNINSLLASAGRGSDPGEAVRKLEAELAAYNSQAEELKKKVEELKQLRDAYEWKPEQIDKDFNDSEFNYRFMMPVDDVFSITGRGTVVTGCISVGQVKIQDSVRIIHPNGSSISTVITGIEQFRKLIDSAQEGDSVGLLCRGINRDQVAKGDVVAIISQEDVAGLSGMVNVELTIAGMEKVKVIKHVRELTGYGLGEAKALVDSTPRIIKQNVSIEEAEYIKRTIESDCQGACITFK